MKVQQGFKKPSQPFMSFSESKRGYMAIFALIIFSLVFAGCQKEVGEAEPSLTSNGSVASDGNILSMYSNIPATTMWELQQARAATAKYRQLSNALKDGYRDIEVDVQNMGHHFMNMDYLNDNTFDYRKPEILVYDDDHQLVAVEYALDIHLPEPSGFSGIADEWDHNTGFGLWLLHAWVWKYNPSGVFKPFNPDVHVHID